MRRSAAASLGAAAVFGHLGWGGANTAAIGVCLLALLYFMRPVRGTASEPGSAVSTT